MMGTTDRGVRSRRGAGVFVAFLVAGLVAGLAGWWAPPAHGATAAREAPPLADVGAVVDRIVPRQLVEGEIPGALVTVVAGGRTVFSRGYGTAHVETGAPMDAATTGFYTASLVKLFTATAVLQLVQAGKLDLDTDVNAYLQGFSVPDTYPGRPVTVHHLLSPASAKGPLRCHELGTTSAAAGRGVERGRGSAGGQLAVSELAAGEPEPATGF